MLPAMSMAPYGLAPLGYFPTGSGPVSELPMLMTPYSGPGFSLPHGYQRPSVPRAAFSHIASVGSCLPAQFAYCCADFQVMLPIGRLASSGFKSGPVQVG